VPEFLAFARHLRFFCHESCVKADVRLPPLVAIANVGSRYESDTNVRATKVKKGHMPSGFGWMGTNLVAMFIVVFGI
jgi:hypothetical protein